MIARRLRIQGSPSPAAIARGLRLGAIVAILALASCGVALTGRGAGRVITFELWAGKVEPGAVALPRVDYGTERVRIRGPVDAQDPVSGVTVPAYERFAWQPEGERHQFLTITQSGVGLGRIIDRFSGLPERRFSGDIVFPLGLWFDGETRRFTATEYTLLGPAERLVTLEIVDLDFEYGGVAHSMSYRLTMQDAAGRVLDCELSVYSPGIGLVQFEGGGHWTGRDCPG